MGGAGWLVFDGFLKQRLRLGRGQKKGGGLPGGLRSRLWLGVGGWKGLAFP